MNCVSRVRRLTIAVAASAVVAASFPAFAQDNTQEISADHLKAARGAVNAIRATDVYDGILPDAAAGLKQTLIQKNPNLQDIITQTVDEKALQLAARRSDLEHEAATIYARVFSAEELNAIAAFYSGAAGQKLITQGPFVLRDLSRAADIWQRGVARDLAGEVGKALETKFPELASPPAQAPAPAADGTAPAPAPAN